MDFKGKAYRADYLMGDGSWNDTGDWKITTLTDKTLKMELIREGSFSDRLTNKKSMIRRSRFSNMKLLVQEEFYIPEKNSGGKFRFCLIS